MLSSLRKIQYLQIEPSGKGTHTNETKMLKMLHLYGFVIWTRYISFVIENNYLPIYKLFEFSVQWFHSSMRVFIPLSFVPHPFWKTFYPPFPIPVYICMWMDGWMDACIHICMYEIANDNKQEILELKLFNIFC